MIEATAGPFAELLAGDRSAQSFVTRALAQLEAEHRALALLALADWERLGIVEPDLFGAIGALQRPSWGSWNFLLQTLRAARRTQLRGKRASELAGATVLQAILGALDANADPALLAAVGPLATHLASKQRQKRLGDVLGLPITLRNQVAHFPPTDDAGWDAIREALVPLVAFRARTPLPVLADVRDWPAPWFLDGDDAERWAFNGLDKDFAVAYASPRASRPRVVPERAGELVRSLQRLLGKTDQQASFHKMLAKLAPDELRGVILGDFLVGPPVGRGGFATVHVGRQLSTGRKVAIKLLHDGLGDDARARFQQEAAFLSRIADPAVVGVISYGEDAWSTPRLVDLTDEPWFKELARGAAIKSYIALEWIDGRTLEAVYQAVHVARTMPPVALATLGTWFHDAALALAAVHSAGLVHRDVKPANLMLTTDGAIRLMDFGVARSDDDDRTLLTSAQVTLGTPPYMSPEQLRLREAAAEVGPSSDVYSLCATFYELFTGRRIYDHDRAAEVATTQKLRGELPVRPRVIVRALPWELEQILIGGLQPELADRYRTAEALARDLERWERNEPIAHRRPSLPRRAALAYRRNRSIANVVGAAAGLLAVGVILYVRSIETERAHTEAALGTLLVEQGRAELVAGHAPAAAAYLDQAYQRGKTDPITRLLLANALRAVHLPAAVLTLGAVVDSVAFSPDGKYFAAGGEDNRVQIWDAHTRAVIAEIAHGGTIAWLAFSPDGRHLASTSWAGDAKLSSVPAGHLEHALAHDKAVLQATWSHDGTRVVTASDDGTAKIWTAATGALVATVHHGDRVNVAVWDARDERIATASNDTTAAVWNARTGEQLASFGERPGLFTHSTAYVLSVAFSADGNHLYTGNRDRGLTVWDLATGATVSTDPKGAAEWIVPLPGPTERFLATHSAGVAIFDAATAKPSLEITATYGYESLALDSTGTRAIASAPGGTAIVWDLASGAPIIEGREHKDQVLSVALSPTEPVLASASRDGTVRLWNVISPLVRSFSGAVSFVRAEVGWAITSDLLGTLAIHDLATGALVTSWTLGHADRPDDQDFAVGVDRAGRYLATTTPAGKVKLWDLATRRVLGELPVQDFTEGRDEGSLLGWSEAAFSARGDRVLIQRPKLPPEIWRISGAKAEHVVTLGEHSSDCGGVSPDGTRAVIGIWNAAAVYELDRGAVIAPAPKGDAINRIMSCGFSPDGDRIVIAFVAPVAALLDGRTGAKIAMLEHHAIVTAWAFTADGHRVATGSGDGTVRVWDARTGALSSTLEGHTDAVGAAAFSHDGTRLVTASADKTIRVWDASSGKQLVSFRSGIPMRALGFLADDVHLYAGDLFHATTVWDLQPETRSPDEVSAIVAREVPLRWIDGALVPK